MGNEQTTLRDTIASALDAEEAKATNEPVAEPVSEPVSEPVKEPTITEDKTAPQPDELKTDKPRDERGRFTTASGKVIQRPSTWKKDYWPHWDNMVSGKMSAEEMQQLAEYAVQREQDFAKGVSTYKGEWDRAKPILEAVQPLEEILQKNGTNSAQWIKDVGDTYRVLTGGSPQEKLNMLFQIAYNYQVPLESIFSQDEQGRFYLNPEAFGRIQTPQQPQQSQPDHREVVKQLLLEERANEQVNSFKSDTEKYPHYDQVRETMAGLLRAGLAQDLQSAYDTALRLPQFAELLEGDLAKQREAEEAKKQREAQEAAARAKAKAVSPKSNTPVGEVKPTGQGIRDTIETAFQTHGGRV